MALTSSYWPADTTIPVRETTVGGVLREAAAAYPDAPALVAGAADPAGRRRWTFSELLADAERAAGALAARFTPGERVAVWAPGLPEWVILEFDAALAGLTLVTVNPAYRAEELRYVLDQSSAAGIFMVPQFRSPMADYLAAVRPELPAIHLRHHRFPQRRSADPPRVDQQRPSVRQRSGHPTRRGLSQHDADVPHRGLRLRHIGALAVRGRQRARSRLRAGPGAGAPGGRTG